MRRFGSAPASTSSRERAAGITRSLAENDPSAQLAGLNTLCDMLNTGAEETLAALRPEQILPGVVRVMTSSMNPEITLLATRSITYFVDAIQGTSAAVASCGGVDAMCSFLLEIRDIELAEQALVGLDKIAQENPAVLLQSRGPEAFLLFVDFFGIVVQRRAVSAVANLARRASPSTFHRFVPILQQLRHMILHEDDRMAENALQALSRIVEGVQSDNNKIQAVLEDAVPGFVEALEGKHAALAAKILSEGAQSPKIAATLIDSGIVTVVAKLLGGHIVRATPAPTPNTQTPQLGASANNGLMGQDAAFTPLQLASNNNNNNINEVITAGPDHASTEQQQHQQQIRPEMALDLVTIILRMLPEVHSKDFMVYLTEGCKFFDRGTSSSGNGRGAGGRESDMARLLQLPSGLPPELQETFRRMLEATGRGNGEAQHHGSDSDESYETVDEDEEGNNNHEEANSNTEGSEAGGEETTTTTASSSSFSSRPSAPANLNVQELARAAGVTLTTEQRWAQLPNDRHQCDACHKNRLNFTDWFRSNERRDCDICRSCFTKNLQHRAGAAAFIAEHGKSFTDMDHFDTVQTLARAIPGLTVAPDFKWLRLIVGNHSCDLCAKRRLTNDDWFRSNDKTDYDVCRACFMKGLREEKATFIAKHGRSFTDMRLLNPAIVTPGAPAQTGSGLFGHSSASMTKKSASTSIAKPAKALTPLVRPEDPRIALLKERSYILPRVAEGMHAIVTYRMGSEDAQLHARVLDLIHRVVAHLTADEIRHFFGDIPLTTILAKTLILDPNSFASASATAASLQRQQGTAAPGGSPVTPDQVIGEHIVSIAICQLLLEKMNKIIVPYFFRNGLSRALTVRSSSSSSSSSSSPTTSASASLMARMMSREDSATSEKVSTKPIQDQLASTNGRRGFVSQLARQLNNEYFKDVEGSKAFDDFTNAAKLLMQYKFKKDADESKSAWSNAVNQLISRFGGKIASSSNNDDAAQDGNNEEKKTNEIAAAVGGGDLPSVSAHEMDDSGMLEGLTSWLQACASSETNNAQNVKEGVMQAVQLVASLFMISEKPSTMMSSATPASLGQKGTNNNNNSFPSSAVTSSPGSTSAHFDSNISPQRQQQQQSHPHHSHYHHHTNTALHRFISILQDIVADCDKFDASNVRVQRRSRTDTLELKLTKEGPAGTSAATTNELKVSIDKQASVGAIEDFLRGNVFHVGRARDGARREDGAENNNNNDEPVEEILPSAGTDAALGSTTSRNNTNAAAANVTAVATAGAVIPVYIRCGANLLNPQQSMIDVISKYLGGQDAFDSASQPLHLHFSIEPFPAGVISGTQQLAIAAATTTTANTGTNRVIYDETHKHRIFLEFKTACVGKLHVDAANVAGPVARAMRLLRIIHAITANLNSLRCFLRMQNLHRAPNNNNNYNDDNNHNNNNNNNSKLPLPELFFAAGPIDQDDAIPGVRIVGSDYLSRRLTAKVEKALSLQTTVGALRESWCAFLAVDCPFLLPLDTRVGIFELGFLGTARGMVRHAERTGANDSSNRGAASPLAFMLNQARGVPRVPRKKFRVWRDEKKALDCAIDIFKRGPDGGTESALEFEFYGEVGSGLGPTLEFYSLACEGLQKKTRGLFRSDDLTTSTTTEDTNTNEDAAVGTNDDANKNTNNSTNKSGFCRAPNGLFLALSGSETDARTVGSLLTRCLMDRRVASMYLSSALVRLLKGEQLVFDDISCILPVSNWHSLMDIHAAGVHNKGVLPGNPAKNQPECPVSALCLSFELPFQPTDAKPFELKPNGCDIDVTESNCVEYVELLAKNLLACDKMRKLVAEMRTPLVSVLDGFAFRLFEAHELASIWKGVDRATTLSEFQQFTVFDHGFNSSHPTAKMLLEVLSEMDAQDQHCFFRFLTGSPSLPVGGLRALRPKFTVVRRFGDDEQMMLPSAMTCQNYLKLPAYETKELLTEKLVQAMNEGAGSFLFT